jgi:Uma2 family endonuclease
MGVNVRRTSAQELLCLPDDGLRHELVAGELRTMAPSGGEHGWVTSDVHVSLAIHVRAQRLGRVFAAETGFLLATNPDTVRAPDVAFVCRERALAVGRQPAYWPEPPDLAIEVVSPGDRSREVAEKIATWLRYGTQMVITIDSRRHTAASHRPDQPVRVLSEADTLDGEDVVPGWTLPLRGLFADE